MKILLCTTTFHNITNGPAKFADFLYRNGNGENGLEVHILTENTPAEKIRLYKCNLGFFKKILPLAPVYRMYKYCKIARKLNSLYHFDFIVYNNAIYGLIHSLYAPNIVGMINDYNSQKNISSQSFFNYKYIRKAIFGRFERWSISKLKLIITNSDYLTRELQLAYPSRDFKIARLYKGVELNESLTKNDCSWDAEDLPYINILFVKSDFLTGGLEILGQSLSFFNLQFVVTIVGPDVKYTNQIENYFKNAKVKVVIVGSQSQQRVYNYMAVQHIFCVPSLQEALGVANLEALNIGIPVVSSDAGGIPEALDYGRCGFLSKAGDPASLADALRNCLYDKEQRKDKVSNGLRYVKKFKADLLPENLQSILHGEL